MADLKNLDTYMVIINGKPYKKHIYKNNEQQKNILDVYSVLYYLECLLRGPYAGALQQEGMKLPDIFNASPDIMGINAENPEQAGSSIPVFTGVTSDLPSITVGKCPSILVQLLQTGKALTRACLIQM